VIKINEFTCDNGRINKISENELECLTPQGKIVRHKLREPSEGYGIDVMRLRHGNELHEFEFQAIMDLEHHKKLVELVKFNFDELPSKAEVTYRDGRKGVWGKQGLRNTWLHHAIVNYNDYMECYNDTGVFEFTCEKLNLRKDKEFNEFMSKTKKT
jgi:hypothetical protein